MTSAARAAALTKVYGSGDTRVTALDSVDVEIETGRFTAIMGPSGSGKSTLMHCLAGLDELTSGQVWIGDTELSALSDKKLTQLRRDAVGFVFQAFNLVPTLSALENITLPLDIAGRKPDQEWLDTVIDTVGLRDRLRHRRATLPERAELEVQGAQLRKLDAQAREVRGRRDVVLADEKRLDDEARSLGARADEGDARLYSGSVNSPRELQAMQADVDMLRRQRDFQFLQPRPKDQRIGGKFLDIGL